MISTDIQGQVGIVTGAGSPVGIGRSIVLRLAEAEAAVIYACDISVDRIDDLKADAKALGSKSMIVGQFLEVSSEEDTKALLCDIIRKHGRFDFFFANAGYSIRRLDFLTSFCAMKD
jgi:3-oxoacyl-[acyl-carrier protein] reductase